MPITDDLGNVYYDEGDTQIVDPHGNPIYSNDPDPTIAFGSQAADYFAMGVLNGSFGVGPPEGVSTAIGSNNNLPYWTGPHVVSGSSITVSQVPDASGTEYNLRFDMAPGAAGDEVYMEHLARIPHSKAFTVVPTAIAYCPTALMGTAGSAKTYIVAQYLQADGTTTTGPENVNVSWSTLTMLNAQPGNLRTREAYPNTTGVVPADAAFVRIRVGLKRDAAATTAAGGVEITDVRLQRGDIQALLTDDTDPATYGPGAIHQMNGSLIAYPAALTHLAGPSLSLSATGDATLSASADARIDMGSTSTTRMFVAGDAQPTYEFWPAAPGGVSLSLGAGGVDEVDTRIYRAAANVLATDDTVAVTEQAAPGTPAAGLYYIYAKTDGTLYGKNDAGIETSLRQHVFDARDYGAVSDGTTDDSDAINAAAAQAEADGGGVVLLRSCVAQGILLRNKVQFRGVGVWGTLIYAPTTANWDGVSTGVFQLNADPVQRSGISNLYIAGRGTEPSASFRAIHLKANGATTGGIWYSQFRDLHISGFNGHAIWLQGGPTGGMYPNQMLLFEAVHVRHATAGDGIWLSGQCGQITFVECESMGSGTTAATGYDIRLTRYADDAETITGDLRNPYAISFLGSDFGFSMKSVYNAGADSVAFNGCYTEEVEQAFTVDAGGGTGGTLLINNHHFANGAKGSSYDHTGAGWLLKASGSSVRAYMSNVAIIGTSDQHVLNTAPARVQVHDVRAGTDLSSGFMPVTSRMTNSPTVATGALTLAAGHSFYVTGPDTISNIYSDHFPGESVYITAKTGTLTLTSGGNIAITSPSYLVLPDQTVQLVRVDYSSLGDGTAAWCIVTLDRAPLASPTFTGIVTTAGQIAFPAAQSASANANTLDDYEEGTWSPVLEYSVPGTSTWASASGTGTYTKIGNRVFWDVTVSGVPTNGTASGYIRCKNLPFTVKIISGYGAVGGNAAGWTKAGFSQVVLVPTGNTTFLYFQASGSGQALTTVAVADIPSGGTVQGQGQGHYLIA